MFEPDLKVELAWNFYEEPLGILLIDGINFALSEDVLVPVDHIVV